MTEPTLTCDGCGSENVVVSIEPVSPHGKRLVASCRACGVAWINTEPSVVERIAVALAEAREAR